MEGIRGGKIGQFREGVGEGAGCWVLGAGERIHHRERREHRGGGVDVLTHPVGAIRESPLPDNNNRW